MEFKSFYRKLDNTLRTVEGIHTVPDLLTQIAERILNDLGGDLGLTGARLYELHGDHYILTQKWGKTRAALGATVPVDYAVIAMLRDKGAVLLDNKSREFDPAIEGAIDVNIFAALTLGDDDGFLLAYSIEGTFDPEFILSSLRMVRNVVNLKMKQDLLQNALNKAREIQMSLLPLKAPDFPGYDIAGLSVPAEEVGGDLYDFLPLDAGILGVAIADASGHGLPAALQARDAMIGLRMGLEKDLKMAKAIEKLNRVVHASRLSSRFISLFYGELEESGHLLFVNAGHPPPVQLRGTKQVKMTEGGMILGPNPQAIYQRGYARLEPGDIALLYTDGLTEAMNPKGVEYGLNRAVAALQELREKPAAEICKALVERAREFRKTQIHFEDDVTVAVIKRLPLPSEGEAPAPEKSPAKSGANPVIKTGPVAPVK